jgi:hypothetical protein
MSANDVAAQLWGTVQPRPGVVKEDVAQLGSAPRAIEERMVAYTKRAVVGWFAVWVMLAILFGLGDVMLLGVGIRHIPTLSLLFTGLAIWSFRGRRQKRNAILETLQHGAFMRVPITAMRAVERRGKYGQVIYVTYYVTFKLPHAEVTLVSRDTGLSMLQVGLSEEVLWSQTHPDVVVPTYLLVT